MEYHYKMKKFGNIAAIFVLGLVFAAVSHAQTPVKIGLIDSGEFADEKTGIQKFINAVKALNTELAPRVKELTDLQTKMQALAEEIKKLENVGPGVPVNQKAILDKRDEGGRMQREFEFKKNEYDAYLEKRSNDVLGPIQADIAKAIQEFATKNGYTMIFDLDKLGPSGALLAMDPKADITKEFIVFYNARPATAAAPR